MGFFDSIFNSINPISGNVKKPKDDISEKEGKESSKPKNYEAISTQIKADRENSAKYPTRASSLKDEPLKEPEMPDLRVPEEFLDKVVENRVKHEKFKNQIDSQRENT